MELIANVPKLMLKKKIAIPVAVATVATVATIGIATALASTPEGAKAFGRGWFGPGFQAATEALQNNDYESWKQAIQSEVSDLTSQEKFEQLQQVEQLRQDGKYEEAANLAQELGLPGRHGQGSADKEAMRTAIENNDFNAWKTAMESRISEKQGRLSELSGKLNEDTFNKMVQAHQLRQDGKYDEAKTIMEGLGMPLGRGGNGLGLGQGQGRGR